MCLKVKDILFPFNIFGKKKQSIAYDTTDTPIEGHAKVLTIKYEGERIVCRWNQVNTRGRSTKIIPHTEQYTDEGWFELRISYGNTIDGGRVRIQNETVYFECTNPEELVVNGERLI